MWWLTCYMWTNLTLYWANYKQNCEPDYDIFTLYLFYSISCSLLAYIFTEYMWNINKNPYCATCRTYLQLLYIYIKGTQNKTLKLSCRSDIWFFPFLILYLSKVLISFINVHTVHFMISCNAKVCTIYKDTGKFNNLGKEKDTYFLDDTNGRIHKCIQHI